MATNINKRRAKWAMAGLEVFAKECGQDIKLELGECISDLIADLLHLAHQNNLDTEFLHQRARDHFAHELKHDE